MDIQVSRCAAAFVVSISVVAGACSDREGALPGSPVAPFSSTQSLQISAEPDPVIPQLLSTRDCVAGRAGFRAGLNLIIIAQRQHSVRAIVFGFVDQFGSRAVPTFLPTQSGGFGSSPVSLPSSVPIPIPSGTVLPIPGTFAFNGRMLNVSQRLPFLLELPCGVRPAGTLNVDVETTDDRGRHDISRLTVRISR